jgi:hypothetical protein
MARVCGTIALAGILLMVCNGAFAQCKAPAPVRHYLKGHRSWSVVDAADLSRGDRLSWRRAHRRLCPGIAILDLGGRGHKSYALAVTNRIRGGRMERLILLEANGKRLAPKTLIPAFRIGDPLVVWRSRKRTVREFGSRRHIAIAHDSVVFEKIGMSAKIFYLADGKIRTVLVTD